ncbi:hypothetical protein [Flavobacterium oreochromis]|uniref:Uncharacterized protein n=2 Tax=Flavobacterium TaxID=237 RepID=A0A2D0AHM2_9FLAO|nr:hypothetical protein [Flavobacterium oreochromis]OWP75672.1 hypothetical protein BWK62_11425 [Flavobacterium oreochromis]OWP78311.1 hypothetical protein BWG23_02220 [Flavobacterium oreochromis]POR25269.1 hypothetical protein BWK58_07095 [Flavobacterium columnare]
MILKHFYKEKLSILKNELNSLTKESPTIHLYTEDIFNNDITTPIFMFKYDTIKWESSSEKTYKADVLFSISIVLPKTQNLLENYELAFDYAQKIDTAILTKNHNNKFIDNHSTFKIEEKQHINANQSHWTKDNFFIWEITYKTTLVENTLKRKYILINNGTSDQEINNLGYTSDDFIRNENQLKIEQNLETNSKKNK